MRGLLGSLMLLASAGAAACTAEDAAPEAEAPPAEVSVDAPASGDAAFLDPNAASRDELLTAPGVDEALADALVAGRPYDDMTAVDAVVGTRLSDEQKDELYARVWVPLDLNSATEEEILLIPGVGPNMAEEFEEYRPYDDMARFRREIGKYVDEAEVARLERYVMIR